ncbi:MAG: ATP-binding protein [Deltaproteobacteria bacterium]|nr:ATP-binding protein [Deltaproteobacteria bacterium]
MLSDTVAQHRAERDRLAGLPMVLRSGLDKARDYLPTDLIKVITGPRRAGKSVFAFQLLADTPFAYLNFDDEKLVSVSDYDELLAALFHVYPEAGVLLLDEIQNLPRWELFVNKLQRRGHNLVLTGSNARMLSGELATSLTGRYVEIELLPFSFSEFLAARGALPAASDLALPEVRGRTLQFCSRYLVEGGFPEVTVRNLPPSDYLSTLVDAVLFKDIVRRHRIRHPQRLYELSLHLTSSFAAEYTASRLSRLLGFNSVTTVETYLGHLEQAFLLSSLSRYSHKTGQLSRPPRKAYVVDTGLVAAATFQVSPATGRLMENCVFLELLRRGYRCRKDLFYFKAPDGQEVDFVLRRGTRVSSLVQVCLDLEPARKRELSALVRAARLLDCKDLTVITWDLQGEEAMGGHTVRLVPMYRWLLDPPGRACPHHAAG